MTKREVELTERDFKSAPVWTFDKKDDDGEPGVVVCREKTIPKRGAFLVGATVSAPGGRTFAAYASVTSYGSYTDVGPFTLFGGREPLELRSTHPGWSAAIPENERAYLPLSWVLSANLDGETEPRRGSVSASRFTNAFRGLVRSLKLQHVLDGEARRAGRGPE